MAWDLGASYGLVLYEDFVDCLECYIHIKDTSKFDMVVGIGAALHKFTTTNCDLLFVPTLSYHLPSNGSCTWENDPNKNITLKISDELVLFDCQVNTKNGKVIMWMHYLFHQINSM